MARVLKPGALAFVTVLTSNSFYEIAHSSLHELYHTKSFKGVVPALGVNPLSLSATSQFGIRYLAKTKTYTLSKQHTPTLLYTVCDDRECKRTVAKVPPIFSAMDKPSSSLCAMQMKH